MFSSKAVLLSFLPLLGLAQELNLKLTLPWGTWEAAPLEGNEDIYLFENVRFGSNPIRFGPSSFPEPISNNATIQNRSGRISCYQISIANIIGGGNSSSSNGQTEDCLFLDIYVPKAALVPGAPKLPVATWFYGGAFAFGEKGPLSPNLPLYSGQGLVEASREGMIFVAGNYRLGAFGWLAGTYMEQSQQDTLPNAGLYDQRLTLEFVQDFIGQVGGNAKNVTAWGESAGASSILHHIVQFNGTRDPLFNKAVIESPAYEWQYDRNGTLNDYYLEFSEAAGCGRVFNVSCLRDIEDVDRLVDANQAMWANYNVTGIFPVGPSVDGTWVAALPDILIEDKKYWSKLDSILVSHVADEGISFAPKTVTNNATLQVFLTDLFPEPQLAPVRARINTQYNCSAPPYNSNYTLCVAQIIGDSSFYCNTRELYNAYPGKSYMMKYSFPGPLLGSATHASDLLPEFINSSTNLTALFLEVDPSADPTTVALTVSVIEHFAPQYKAYMASYGTFGDPNVLKNASNPVWSPATTDLAGNELSQVLQAELGAVGQNFELVFDSQNAASVCDFWAQQARTIESFKWDGRY